MKEVHLFYPNYFYPIFYVEFTPRVEKEKTLDNKFGPDYSMGT